MTTASNVVPMPAATPSVGTKEETESDKKFGRQVTSHGLFILPALMLRAQARLKINNTEMIVLLQLLEFWWSKDRTPYPAISTIAERVTLSTKQVQRIVNTLADKKLITRINRTLPNGGKTTNEYKFDGLIAELKRIEPDFEVARQQKKAAGKAGGLLANKAVAP